MQHGEEPLSKTRQKREEMMSIHSPKWTKIREAERIEIGESKDYDKNRKS
jgi:hypothetical protein